MSETNWTPGPWRVEPTFETDESDPQEIRTQRLILAGDRQYIAETLSDHARLIASAPELYEALSALVDHCDAMESEHRDYHQMGESGVPCRSRPLNEAIAALRKARGE